jgi:hypothetical protein
MTKRLPPATVAATVRATLGTNELTTSERLLYIAMLARADERGAIDPGDYGPSTIEALAHSTALTMRTVRKLLTHLEDLGLIRSIRRRREDGGTAPIAIQILASFLAEG